MGMTSHGWIEEAGAPYLPFDLAEIYRGYRLVSLEDSSSSWSAAPSFPFTAQVKKSALLTAAKSRLPVQSRILRIDDVQGIPQLEEDCAACLQRKAQGQLQVMAPSCPAAYRKGTSYLSFPATMARSYSPSSDRQTTRSSP